MHLKSFLPRAFALGLISSSVFAGGGFGMTCDMPTLSEFAQKAQKIVHVNGTVGGPGINLGCNHLKISALANLDAKYTNHGPIGVVPGFLRGSESDLYVNNANVLFDFNVNSAVHAHLGIAYLDDSYNKFFTKAASTGRSTGAFNDDLGLDEFYVAAHDFDQSPFFVKAGRYFLPYGDDQQKPYPITRSLVQLMTQARNTAIEAGAVSNTGFYGSLFATNRFDNAVSRSAIRNKFNNVGGRVGYTGTMDDATVNINGSYLHDIRAVQFVEDQFVPAGVLGTRANGFRRAAGFAGHADVAFGQFTLAGDFAATSRALIAGTVGRKPLAFGVTGGYHFDTMGRDSVAHIGVQGTRKAAAFLINPNPSSAPALCPAGLIPPTAGCASNSGLTALPKWRVMADYDVNVLPNTDIILEYIYDRSYRGVGLLKDTHTVAARLSVAV